MKIRMHRHIIEGVLAQLMNHPEQFHWGTWLSRNNCGTIACIAGWIAELNCPKFCHGWYKCPSGEETLAASGAAIDVLTFKLNPDTQEYNSMIHCFLYDFLFTPDKGHWYALMPDQKSNISVHNASRNDAIARLKWLLDGLKPIQYIAPGCEVSPKLCEQYADLEIELV